jgi:alkylation response protein AidB-like acyl-CoA dehydrogenase
LTPEELACFLEQARDFSESALKPQAQAVDNAGALPRSVLDELARRGYLGSCLPKAFGGLGLDSKTYGQLTLAIGKGCPATRSVLTVHTSLVGETLARWGSREQQERWLGAIARGEKLAAFALTEPGHGSDARGIETTYKKTESGYVLNGHKRWITLGTFADLFLVLARAEGTDTLSAFLVERQPGLKTGRIEGLLAARAAGVADVTLAGLHVPPWALLGDEGAGLFPIGAFALWAGRYSVAWGGLAIAEAALDAMVEYAKRRLQFGRPIADYQLVREMIAEATVKVHAGRALCIKAGESKDAGEPSAPLATTVAKYYTARAAMEITTDAVQVHGANGFGQEYPVARLFREAKLLEIIEGTTQIHQKTISDYALQAFGPRS